MKRLSFMHSIPMKRLPILLLISLVILSSCSESSSFEIDNYLDLNQYKVELVVGATSQLTIRNFMTAGEHSVTWLSSNTQVASVSSSGLVTAKYPGTATITVRIGTQSDQCYVTVKSLNHDVVDLGLPSGTLWATMNIGASQEEDYGYYFAWAETTGYPYNKTTFYVSNYKWFNYGDEKYTTKYCTNSAFGTVDNRSTLQQSDDAAYNNWGEYWCIPTVAQARELLNNCTVSRVTRNGVAGLKLTSTKNGNTIFFPSAGYRSGNSCYDKGSQGGFWTNQVYDSGSYNGACGVFWGYNDGEPYQYTGYSYYRYVGRSVRAVVNKTW